jgi:hypothetical protein
MIRRIGEHPRQNQEEACASWLWRNLPFLPDPWKHSTIYLFQPIFPHVKLEMIQKKGRGIRTQIFSMRTPSLALSTLSKGER